MVTNIATGDGYQNKISIELLPSKRGRNSPGKAASNALLLNERNNNLSKTFNSQSVMSSKVRSPVPVKVYEKMARIPLAEHEIVI